MDVMLSEMTPLEADLSYPEHPIKVLDQKDCVMRRKTIKFFKIQWSNNFEEEATWKVRIFSILSIQTSSCHSQNKFDYLLFLLEPLLLPNLGSRFLLGGRAVTTWCYCSSCSIVTVSHYIL
jgi:hypothetical protein